MGQSVLSKLSHRNAHGTCAHQWITCTCCQYPECCCCDFCMNTRCGYDFVTCADFFPCCVCWQVNPKKTVFLAGLEGAGKTTLLYYFLLNSVSDHNPTRGANNEIVTFNRWQKYEFWDPSGSAAQRPLWRKYYSQIRYDYVVYVINGFKWVNADQQRKESVFDDDRMELHALLNEVQLSKARFMVYINFKDDLPQIQSRQVIEEATDALEVGPNSTYTSRGIEVVTGWKNLLSLLEVAEVPYRGCFCT